MARSNVVCFTLLIHIHDPNEVIAYAQGTIISRLDKKTSLVQDRALWNHTVVLKLGLVLFFMTYYLAFSNIKKVDLYLCYWV